MKKTPWKNRIVGEAEVDPKDLTPNPLNWRRHPAHQREALSAVLGEIGWVGKVLVNKTTGHILDGHARQEEALDNGEPTVPVTYVELTVEEEKKILATYDPLGAMADKDDEGLRQLLEDLEIESPAIQAMLDDLLLDDKMPVQGDPSSSTKEIDPDAFEMDSRCPRCGFEFNDE